MRYPTQVLPPYFLSSCPFLWSLCSLQATEGAESLSEKGTPLWSPTLLLVFSIDLLFLLLKMQNLGHRRVVDILEDNFLYYSKFSGFIDIWAA